MTEPRPAGSPPTRRAGIGLRQPHYAQVVEEAPPLGFIEVHSENFFADGGASLSVLHEARTRYDVSLHGVGLALGSAAGVDPWHLDRLAQLVDRIAPVERGPQSWMRCGAGLRRSAPRAARPAEGSSHS